MQKRSPVGSGPSSKTWPRWLPQRLQRTSTRTMPWRVVAHALDHFAVDRLPVAGPAAAGVELGGRFEQRRAAAHAQVLAGIEVVPVLAGEGALGGGMAGHLVLHGVERLAPFGVALADGVARVVVVVRLAHGRDCPPPRCPGGDRASVGSPDELKGHGAHPLPSRGPQMSRLATQLRPKSLTARGMHFHYLRRFRAPENHRRHNHGRGTAIGAGRTAARCSLAGPPKSGQTVKIAFIDPLSGPFANVGQNQLKSWQFSGRELQQEERRPA